MSTASFHTDRGNRAATPAAAETANLNNRRHYGIFTGNGIF